MPEDSPISRAKLSVAIITLNEEANLARTLASVKFADEIIIFDSGSVDRTVAIGDRLGATVIYQPWLGFAQQKNAAIERCTGDWILSLDADEELTPELQTSIQAVLTGQPTVGAFMMKRRNLFMGRWIRHAGYYPDAKLRLFRRTTANFIPAARFANREVHEVIAYDGEVETLDGDLIHYAYPTLSAYIDHMDRYSSLGAQVLIRRGRTSRSTAAFLLNVLLVPQLTFFYNYVLRLGFLDGREGLLQNLYHAMYTSWKYAKAWELSRENFVDPLEATSLRHKR